MQTKHLVVDLPFIDHLLARGDYSIFSKRASDNSPRMKEMKALYIRVEQDKEAFVQKAWDAYRINKTMATKYYNRVKKLSL